MKRYASLFKVRPAIHVSPFLIVLGLLILPYVTHANDLDHEIKLESWMVTPFETEFAEFEIQLESWMVNPFETEFAEFEIQLESWMVTPFETEFAEVEIPLENWMTDNWF